MALGKKDLIGDISVIDFRIVFGTAAVSSDHQKVVINYTGYAFPALANGELTTYEYSLDNGSTWQAMTPSSGTDLTSLGFSAGGTAHTFEWEAKADEGTDFYNVTVRIRMNAESGSDETGVTSTSYYFERTSTNVAQSAQPSPFPESYAGQSGNELMRGLAPRL